MFHCSEEKSRVAHNTTCSSGGGPAELASTHAALLAYCTVKCVPRRQAVMVMDAMMSSVTPSPFKVMPVA